MLQSVEHLIYDHHELLELRSVSVRLSGFTPEDIGEAKANSCGRRRGLSDHTASHGVGYLRMPPWVDATETVPT